jgi:type VI secretion system protein ImpA
MAALPTGKIDLEVLLAPLSSDQATGSDLREDFSPNSLYFRLRDARAEARDAERQAESAAGEAAAPVQWRVVQDLATQALAEHSKDLEVASWLTEALVRTAGLSGLATAAAVIGGLLDRYWDDLYPQPDEEGVATRVGPLAGLSGQGYDGTLLQPLRRVVLFNRPDGTPFGYWQYLAAVDLAGITDPVRRAQRIEAGTVPFDEVEKEARLAGSAHWSARRREVAAALLAWSQMASVLDEKSGSDSPSTSRVRDLLAAMEEACGRFAPADALGGVDVGADEAPLPASGSEMAAGTQGGPAVAGRISGREQALAQLGEIAAWFKRNEPHSPLAYTLDEAVRRGRMAWPELLDELMPDETSRHALLTSLGIRPIVSG